MTKLFRRPAKLHPFRGETKTVEEIASILGLTKRAVYIRIERDMPLDELMKRGPKAGIKMKPRRKPGTKTAEKPNPKMKTRKKTPQPKQPKPPVIRFMPRNINRRTDLSALFGGA